MTIKINKHEDINIIGIILFLILIPVFSNASDTNNQNFFLSVNPQQVISNAEEIQRLAMIDDRIYQTEGYEIASNILNNKVGYLNKAEEVNKYLDDNFKSISFHDIAKDMCESKLDNIKKSGERYEVIEYLHFYVFLSLRLNSDMSLYRYLSQNMRMPQEEAKITAQLLTLTDVHSYQGSETEYCISGHNGAYTALYMTSPKLFGY